MRLRDLPAPTLRLYLAALLLTAPLALGEVAAPFVGIAGAGAVVLLALILADLGAAVRPADLEVERRHHPRLYLGDDNVVELVVTNRSRRAVEARLRDTPPVPFRTSTLFVRGTVPPADGMVFRYTTRPTSRGRFRFGTV